MTDVSPQHQIIDQVDNPRHGGIGAPLMVVGIGEINRLTTLQQAPSQQEIVDIRRRGL